MSRAVPEAIATLHAVVEGKAEPMALAEWIADDAVFHSPVMHTPQEGKFLVMQYLGAALQMFAPHGFTYRRDVIDGSNCVLEFTVEMDGVHVNGVDIITLNDDGKISEFKVMIRPLKAIEKVRETMLAMLPSR
ncbi:nuclear transport factor 2 family protein [Aurantiacibacter sp. D1-12]|uniref:nuclear transport factor 2 family protein n=1 Tax=Aurantiacibacter sp. D1-12 TaxID=2993658 RepID=UPI00237C9C0B|nr:nuclear transport factor 2 family protein [Aurantiacibacter sp. D1-12]MDE1468133.1 nuclear transport factor 2 family protein [Aurantiacibacter sp. D1-12]